MAFATHSGTPALRPQFFLLCAALALVACDGGGSVSGDDGGPEDGGMCAADAPDFGDPCRSDADCEPLYEYCLAPGQTPYCGARVCPQRGCSDDATCGAIDPDTVCVTRAERCYVSPDGSCDPAWTECAPRCTETSCAAGEECTAEGHCVPASCDAGYTCPAFTVCTPGAAGADPHGCVRRQCGTDADCGCGGACVRAYCYDVLGACRASAG